jgi:hypothetical protein
VTWHEAVLPLSPSLENLIYRYKTHSHLSLQFVIILNVGSSGRGHILQIISREVNPCHIEQNMFSVLLQLNASCLYETKWVKLHPGFNTFLSSRIISLQFISIVLFLLTTFLQHLFKLPEYSVYTFFLLSNIIYFTKSTGCINLLTRSFN